MLSGIGVIELLSGNGWNLERLDPQSYASFFPAFIATFLQGTLLLVEMLAVMLPTAPVAWLCRKCTELART
jgi:hypothetical protein